MLNHYHSTDRLPTMAIAHQAQQVVMPIGSHHAGGFTLETTIDKSCYLVADDLAADERFTVIGQTQLPLLAQNEAEYAGQPFALVFAPTAWQANLYRQELKIRYSGKTRFRIHQEYDHDRADVDDHDRVVVQRKLHRGLDIEYIFDTAATVSSQKFHLEATTLQLEDSFGAYACFENEKIIVYLVTAWASRIESALLQLFKLEAGMLEVRSCQTADLRDLFSVHAQLAACYVVAALLRTGKSSRLVLSAQRPFFSSNLGGNLHLELSAALSKEGSLLALRCVGSFNTGAYAIALDEVIDRMVWALAVRYNKVALGVEMTAKRSYGDPALPDATFGIGNINYALESFMAQLLQRARHRSAKEWRTIFYSKGAIDAFGYEWKHDASYVAIIKKLYQISDYTRKYDAYHQEAQARKTRDFSETIQPYRGIGMAFGELPSGFLRHHYCDLWVRLTLLGAHHVLVQTNAQTNRASTMDYWRKCIAHELGLQSMDVNIETDSTLYGASNAGSVLGSNVHIVHTLLMDACEELQKRRFRESLPISVELKSKRHRRWKDQLFEGDVWERVSRIAVASEVEVDINTFNVYTRSLSIVIDAGRILQPEVALNQIYLDVEDSLNTLSSLHIRVQEERDYPDVVLSNTLLLPKKINVEFMDKRYREGAKSRVISGLVQTALPIALLQATSQALLSPIAHPSLQNEAIYLQHQWINMMKTLQPSAQPKE